MDVLKGGRRLLLGMGLVAALPLHGATGRSSEVAVKDRANANASLAVSGQFAALVWSASAKDATDMYVATSRDGGRAFGAPARVNRTSGDANANGEQPPRVALVPRGGGDPSIVIVWTAKSPTGTKLWTARSDDGARAITATRRREMSSRASRFSELARSEIDVELFDLRSRPRSAPQEREARLHRRVRPEAASST